MLNLHALTLTQSKQVQASAHNLSSELLSALKNMPNIELHVTDDQSINEAALMTAVEILSGRQSPLIELRRDGLGSSDPYRPIRKTLTFFACAAAVFLIALTVGFSYRAYRYDLLASENQDQQTAVFREALPGQPVPAGIRSRLESEHAKMAGLKGEADALPERSSALKVLYDVMASMPDGIRYRFRELRFDQRRAVLDGEVRTHGDADGIANGLRKRGFQVQPPKTQQLSDKGVSLRILAELESKGSAKPGT
jgi:hypothetical protein